MYISTQQTHKGTTAPQLPVSYVYGEQRNYTVKTTPTTTLTPAPALKVNSAVCSAQKWPTVGSHTRAASLFVVVGPSVWCVDVDVICLLCSCFCVLRRFFCLLCEWYCNFNEGRGIAWSWRVEVPLAAVGLAAFIYICTTTQIIQHETCGLGRRNYFPNNCAPGC